MTGFVSELLEQAQLDIRLHEVHVWQELEHGGEVELHIAGSSRPILPQFFEREWSQGTHALFARQEPDGSITLEAVAWESIQRVVVRKVQGLPDGMFLDEGES